MFLRLGGRRCVVIGEDELAATKALACARAGARVVVIAPVLPAMLAEAAAAGTLTYLARPVRRGDLKGAFLAYASVTDRQTVAQLRDEAESEGVLLNVVDVPEACDFFAGALVERGPLTILIGTDGTAPAAAGVVRRVVADAVGDEYRTFVEVIAAVRRRLATHPARGALVRALVQSDLLGHIRRGDVAGIEQVVHEATGESCSLPVLGVAVSPR